MSRTQPETAMLNNMERIKPDWMLAFAQLAPFVTAAAAHASHDDLESVKGCLEKACAIIEASTQVVYFMELDK